MIAGAILFGLSSAANAQCPQICDNRANTALGDSALINNTTGANNTAIGFDALSSNRSGGLNTAVGYFALFANISGFVNVAIGPHALSSNTTGEGNTAIGNNALGFNTTGDDNTAIGNNALSFNTSDGNTAIGSGALDFNTTGTDNTAIGVDALFSNTTGNFNMAAGNSALSNNTTGKVNTAIGDHALLNNTTGNNNIALGYLAGSNLTTSGNNIDVGDAGLAGDSKTIRIGTVGTQRHTFIAGITGETVAGGVGVMIDSRGHLGTVVSSERFKSEIKPMDEASEAILLLKPVTFRYKHELDPAGIPQFALVAEDVEKVNPDLVAPDEQGKAYTVRYEAVNAMLLNEFLKEHRKVEALERSLAGQKQRIDALEAALKRQSTPPGEKIGTSLFPSSEALFR